MTDHTMATGRHAADAASLMLLAGTDREGFDAMVKTVRNDEVAPLLMAACEVGGSLVRVTDQHPEDRPLVADVLRELVAAYRDGEAEPG